MLQVDDDGSTALHFAARCLSADADGTEEDPDVSRVNVLECINWLVQAGGDVNAQTKKVCPVQPPSSVALLLQHQAADANAAMLQDKRTPLHCASSSASSIECVKLLLSHGAEVDSMLEQARAF